MITFTIPKTFVDDPEYKKKKKKSLIQLEDILKKNELDLPIKKIMIDLNKIPCCFTLQSCYGHFVHLYQKDDNNIEPLSKYPTDKIDVLYRIAYVAFCIENNEPGKLLLEDLKLLVKIDTRYIQFGSSDWFWDQCVNSFVLQVSPDRRRYEDKFSVDMKEALYIENVRNRFFQKLSELIEKHI